MPPRVVAEKPTQTPLQMYMQHIERANAGNARSQYRVSQALQMCRMAPKSAERLNASIESGQLSEEQISEVRRRYKLCEGFAALVPDMDADITKWLRMSAEGGEPLAKSYEALLSYPNFDVDELKVLVREALRTGDPEAYSHAVRYYANVTPNDNAELYEAWLLISCEFEAGCDLAQERDRVERQYRLHEALQIASIETSLRENLKAKNWDALGF